MVQQPKHTPYTSSHRQDVTPIIPLPPQAPTFSVESPDYEKLRTKYYNDRLPDARPASIAIPSSTAEVSRLIADAKVKHLKVGVRSGGHLFPACSLIEGGLLIDTAKLNQTFEYNPVTRIAAFGPATTVREAAKHLNAVNRFFPFGHHPSVGLCGFLLAGGQGWFSRGWGYTADRWVEQLEVVMPNSEVVLASRYQNEEVYWAARGSGQGFFGVVTRIWVRTIPSKSLFHRTIMLDASEDYQAQIKWALKKCEATVKYGVDIAIVTHYSDLLDQGDYLKTRTKKLILVVDLTAYADSKEEAITMTSPWDSIDDDIAQKLSLLVPVTPTTWEEVFELQDKIFPNRDRWQCDSILAGKDVSHDEIAVLSEKAMCDLPNRKCIGTIGVVDYYPGDVDQALSLSHRYYISTMTRWDNAVEDVKYSKWMSDAYKPLERISVGQYIADFDVKQRMSKVMTDSALEKFLAIRQIWDPDTMFLGYQGFASCVEN